MAEVKHTPGPWHLEDNHVVSGSVRVAVVDTPSIHAGVDHWEADKNARLIAAAPELLEALRHIEGSAMDISVDRRSIAKAARNAIAKATGGQP